MMNLFRRTEQREANFDFIDDFARSRGLSKSGQIVSGKTAERHSVVFGCADFNAGLISGLPVDVYRSTTDGVPQKVTSPSWLAFPEPDVDLISWLYSVAFSLEINGNAFGLKSYNDRGLLTSVTLLDPTTVSVRRLADGRAEWRVNGKIVPSEKIWHPRSRAKAGQILGMSTLEIARETLGVGQATRDYISEWFGDGAHPQQHVKYTMPPGKSMTEEQASTIRQRMRAAITGREPLVTSDRYTIEQMQLSPADSAFLEVVNANGADICRFMATDPSVVSVPVEGGSITYANREQNAIDNLVYRVGTRIRRLEAALSTLLPRGQYAKLNTGALLQTDTQTRYKTHEIGIKTGMYSPNERRELEDDQPRPDGDVWVDPTKTSSKAEEPANDKDEDDDT